MNSPEKKDIPATQKGGHEHGEKIPLLVEVVGLRESACSPFPCDESRSCGLYTCYPSGSLVKAAAALRDELHECYGGAVELRLTLIDDDMPDHLEQIIAREFPPVPFILINGKLVPLGRISLPRLQQELEKVL